MNWNTPEMYSFIAAEEEEGEEDEEEKEKYRKSTNYAAK